MPKNTLLLVDAAVNVALGALLLLLPRELADGLGLARVEPPFLMHVFGAVLVGIGVALLIDIGGSRHGLGGLGAAAINLCASAALVAWLTGDDLPLTPLGTAVLWGLVVLLIVLSVLHLMAARAARSCDSRSEPAFRSRRLRGP